MVQRLALMTAMLLPRRREEDERSVCNQNAFGEAGSLSAARGIAIGLLLSVLLWAVVGALIL